MDPATSRDIEAVRDMVVRFSSCNNQQGQRARAASTSRELAIQTGALAFLFPLYLVKRGSAGADAVGLIVSLSVLGRLLALWLGGTLSDRWGRLRVLIPGLVTYAALLGTLTLLTHPVALGLGSLVIGGAAGLVAALPTALIGDQVPSPPRGARGAADSVGPAAAGPSTSPT